MFHAAANAGKVENLLSFVNLDEPSRRIEAEMRYLPSYE